MEKASFYGIEWEELEQVCVYLRSNGYHLREEDSSITIFGNDKKIIGEINKIDGLVFRRIPNLNIDDNSSNLEKVLDAYIVEQRGRDSPSASPQSLRSSN